MKNLFPCLANPFPGGVICRDSILVYQSWGELLDGLIFFVIEILI